MKEKVRKILAVVGLVFVAIFSIALALFFANPNMFDGLLAFVCLVSGFVGLSCFLIIKVIDRDKTHGLAGKVDTDGDNYLPTADEEESEEEQPSEESIKNADNPQE